MNTAAHACFEVADRPVALVVEDDAELGALMAYTLERGGWNVYQARDGDQALVLAREQAPDLVVLDLDLTRTARLEVLRALKSHADQPTSVVVVSPFVGCTCAPVVRLADATITKPFRPSCLLEQANRVAKRVSRSPHP